MIDLSRMSNEELLAAYQAAKGSASSSPPRKLSPQDAKQLAEARSAAQFKSGAARDGQAFLDINRDVGTGELWSFPYASEIRGAFDPRFAEMQSLTNKMAPMLRIPGSGATSDKDLAGFKKSVPNPDFPGPTNSAIVGRLTADAQRAQDYAAFLDDYAAQNGTLLGAEAAWAKRSAAPKAAPPKKKPIQSSVTPTGLTDAQRKAAARFLGTQANSGTAGNPSIPITKDQFDLLPRGTHFIAPDGSVRIKP